jgi:hypothetical protein
MARNKAQAQDSKWNFVDSASFLSDARFLFVALQVKATQRPWGRRREGSSGVDGSRSCHSHVWTQQRIDQY